jgi:hypothetical protein
VNIGYHYCSLSSVSLCFRLGTMKVHWESLPNGVRKRLVTDLEESTGKGFDGVALTSLLNGCELLGYRWHLRQGVKQAILSAFSDICRHSQGNDEFAKHIIGCLRHFSLNEMKWKSFSDTVFNFLERHSSLLTPQDLTEVLLH